MNEAGGGAGGEGTLSLLGKWTLDVVIGVVLNESIITGGRKVGGGGLQKSEYGGAGGDGGRLLGLGVVIQMTGWGVVSFVLTGGNVAGALQ